LIVVPGLENFPIENCLLLQILKRGRRRGILLGNRRVLITGSYY
jgi:hypothetical protein